MCSKEIGKGGDDDDGVSDGDGVEEREVAAS